MAMKSIYRCLRIIFLLTLILFIHLNSGCKNPSAYEPPPDSLIPPPDAPNLIAPAKDFVIMPDTSFYCIRLEWDSIEGVETYERELTYDTFPPTTVILSTNFYVLAIMNLGKHSWRVRASSSDWQGGYTAWSETWGFEVRPQPPPPQLLYPPDSTVFYFDDLPQIIGFTWNHVEDEQFYDFQFFLDSTLIEQLTVYATTYPMSIYDPGKYSWRVRAGSQHWQNYTDWSELWDIEIILNNE